MALKLMQTIPLFRDNRFLQGYANALYSIEFRIDPLLWLALSAIVSALGGLGIWLALKSSPKLAMHSVSLGFIIFFVGLDILAGYPYLKSQQRIEKIEDDLPDALRQMSDTLKSGGTYEYALREIANTEFGPLKKEVQEVLRRLEDGENFENSLKALANNVNSRIVKRTVTIIVDSVAAGAGLAGVLDQIAEDVREMHKIEKERKSKTVLQVIFMFTAGGLIAPMIFGFVSTISSLLIAASTAAVSAAKTAQAKNALGVIHMSIQAYLFIETIATGIMIGVMREGKISKSIIYIPVLLCIAYISYLVAGIVSATLIGVSK